MTRWTSDEIARIGAADELELAALRRDGTLRNPVTIWVVRHGDDLYVRSAYGPDSGGCALFQLSPNSAKKVWEKKGFKGINSKFQTPILDNGYLYGVESRGGAEC